MARGVVKWFDRKKGYGFITAENASDVFVHYSNITMDGYRTLEEGQPVEFDLRETEKGLQAYEVRPASDGTAA